MVLNNGLNRGAVLMAALLLSACGSGGDSDSTMPGSTPASQSSSRISSVTPSSASSLSSSQSSASESSIAMSSQPQSSASSLSMSSASSVDGSANILRVIYPGQHAHLGGASQTKLVVAVNTRAMAGVVTGVKINDQLLTADGDYWLLDSLPVTQLNGPNEYTVAVEANGQWQTGSPLILNNLAAPFAAQAGANRIYSAKGIAFDTDDTVLYFSNPYDARLYKYDTASGASTVVYQGNPSTQLSEALNWPIAVDSDADTVYISADEYSYTGVASNRFTVSMVKVENANTTATSTVYPDVNSSVTSTRSLILDADSVALTSALLVSGTKEKTVYSLNNGPSPVMRWYLSGVFEGAPNPLNLRQGTGAKFTASHGLLALAAKPNFSDGTMIGVREYGSIQKRGLPALVEIASVVNNTGDVVTSVKLLTELTGISRPTALLYNRAGTHVYIADNNRIWLMDMADYSKVLVSSSNTAASTKGVGPYIGAKVAAMVLHPTLNYLYLAADTNGVMMVDLATGNRAVLAK